MTKPIAAEDTARPWRRWMLRGLHWLIIGNFVVEIIYCAYMVFCVIAPDAGGPLFEQAKTFPFEMMVTRRLYALEFWVAFGGLAIYLAITEIGPRLCRRPPPSP